MAGTAKEAKSGARGARREAGACTARGRAASEETGGLALCPPSGGGAAARGSGDGGGGGAAAAAMRWRGRRLHAVSFPLPRTPGCASGRSVAASFAETSGARLALHAALAALQGARAELPVGRHTSAHVLRTVLLALLAARLATATRCPTGGASARSRHLISGSLT